MPPDYMERELFKILVTYRRSWLPLTVIWNNSESLILCCNSGMVIQNCFVAKHDIF